MSGKGGTPAVEASIPKCWSGSDRSPCSTPEPAGSARNLTGPAHGTLAFNVSTGAFTYTPAADYNGPDSFTFQAGDGTLDSNVATVSITVNPVNDAPVASNGSLSTDEDTAQSGILLATDVDSVTLGRYLAGDLNAGEAQQLGHHDPGRRRGLPNHVCGLAGCP